MAAPIYKQKPHYNFGTAPNDTVSFSHAASVIKRGNALHISFAGKLQDPLKKNETGIQLKIIGCPNHQKGTVGIKMATDDNLTRFAQSDWKSGQALDYEVDKERGRIKIIAPEYGEIGFIAPEVSKGIIELLDKYDLSFYDKNSSEKFTFELGNLKGGNTKSYPMISMTTNFKYHGENPETKKIVKDTFSGLFNNAETRDSVNVFQPKTSPEEVLDIIFDVEGKLGTEAKVKEIKEAVNNISDAINDPNNKRILLLGHNNPDGDTVGCVLGLKAAISGAYPDRKVDCAVDDKVPAFLKKNMPGIENLKRVYNKDKVDSLVQAVSNPQTDKSQIPLLEKEVDEMTNPKKIIDKDNTEYDLVIMMDIPSPKRFSNAFQPYVKNAKNIIYIDHHPHNLAEWDSAKGTNGVNMEKSHQDGLALVCERVPAAVQLVAAIADKSGILQKTIENSAENTKNFMAAIMTGLYTDTGSFKWSGNASENDKSLSAEERPNFRPEGMADYLVEKTGGVIDKKWLRDNLNYELSDTPIATADGWKETPLDKIKQYCTQNFINEPNLGLGIIKIGYDKFYDTYKTALEYDENVMMTDIHGAFKNSEFVGNLKKPNKSGAYYDNDKIGVFIMQDEKKGSLDSHSEISKSDSMYLSFRCNNNANHAELLGNLFGGGHGAAASGRISGDGVTPSSKFLVQIDGVTVNDDKKLYETVKKNIESQKNNEPLEFKKITFVQSGSGRTCNKIISDFVTQIRGGGNDSVEVKPAPIHKKLAAVINNAPTVRTKMSKMEQAQIDLASFIEAKDYAKILKYFEMITTKNADGTLTLSHFCCPRGINYSDLGIDEQELLKNVTKIKGDAAFARTNIVSLGSVKEIGANVDFRNSKVKDLGELESVGKEIIIENSLLSKEDFGNVKIGRVDKSENKTEGQIEAPKRGFFKRLFGLRD